MAEELVLFGVEKLWNLLSQEYELLKGVEDQVSELRSDLDLLKSFLKDAGAKKHTSALVRHCVDEIKEIVYDAEDVIEEFILKERHGKESGFEKRIRRFACFIPERREIAPYITCISKRISRVVRNMQSFNVQQKIEDDSVRLQSNREWEMRQTFSKEYESDFVGLETDIDILIEKLVKNDNVQVVTVTGIGGLGKTTLVRQFFNHNDVKTHFNRFAWVCVSQDFTLKNVWQKILIDLKPKEEKKNILEMAESTLQGELFLLLETSKSLIVLDDVWKEEDWHLIKPIFPPTKGWKVLLTSRNNIVAVPGDTKYYNHKVKCLTSEESWTLFERIAFPRKYVFGSSMEEKAKEILNKHCKGLPLAVKVFGGLLATKYSSDDWERVFENIGSHMMGKPIFNDDNNRSIYHVLSVSFEELPSYLKHCFLFLAHFPEDHEINVEILSYYWAAEGIFEARHYNGETIRDLADDCIEELVRRNMVISKRDVLSSKYETCHLHDMMKEMCLLKAKEENFLHIINVRSSTSNSRSPCRSRRLFCQIPTTLDIERYINNFKLRSLLIVKTSPLTGRSFKRLKFLRVLDLFCIEFQKRKLVSSIGKLIHLRYLNLKDVILSHLPSSIGNLTLLIYLNLKVSVVPIFVPNVLMGMQDLRYLVLPNYMHKMTKLQLSSLVNLEGLKRFSTKNCWIEDLRGMVRLKTLSIWITDETSIEAISASIGGLEHLEYLRIEDEDGKSEKKNKEGLVLNFINLKRLILSIYMPRLPKEHFPSSLTFLYLRRCRLQEDPMPIIEKLPQLKLVILEERSFCGKKMVCSAGRFPQLEELSLIGLDEWQEWIVEDGSMPLLHTLTIIFCPNLKELPDGIYSVKDLTISKKWKKRLSEGGEDYNKVKHMPSVAFIQDY